LSLSAGDGDLGVMGDADGLGGDSAAKYELRLI